MNWVRKCKLSATEALQYNRCPCTEFKDLWQALYQMSNSVQNCQVNICLLEEVFLKSLSEWPNFLKEEFRSAVKKCNNLSTPGSNCVSWRHFKVVVDNDKYLSNIANITNACINHGHWLLHFKISTLIIIPKPNKVSYNSLKMFCLIFLFNILGKLIKKVIRERL